MLGYMMLALFFVTFSMLANRVANSVVTAPMAFLGFGALLAGLGMVPDEGSERALHLVTEIALIILLFFDAAKIDQGALLRRNVWPRRMLAIGMPLGFLIGTMLAWLLLPAWPLALAALAAAILLPTDVALGQPVITNVAIPDRPRRAMTVESGLNDGLALPLVLLMAALAAPGGMDPGGGWLLFGLKQVTLGPLMGGAIGTIGGFALLWAKRTRSTADIHEGIGALALAALAYLTATTIGGNGFISAFVAGLGFGAVVRGRCAFVYEFTESEGQLLSWTAFLLLGAVLVPQAAADLTLGSLAFILACLLIVRPLAIWVSLIGTDAKPVTRIFLGWFGPRGLATALFALLVFEQLEPGSGEYILHLAVNAVWISAILHGVSAGPVARWYARRLGQDASEGPIGSASPRNAGARE